MAAARSYRDDFQRLRCGSNRLPKDGRSRGKQTYRCRLCHYRFTPDGNRHYYPEQVKEQAIDRYGEGMAIAAISRVLEVKPAPCMGGSKKSVGPWAFGLGDIVGQGQHQRHGMLGGGHRIAHGGVDHGHAGAGGGVQVDIVHADAGAGHYLEVAPGGDDSIGDAGFAADNQGIIIADGGDQFVRG